MEESENEQSLDIKIEFKTYPTLIEFSKLLAAYHNLLESIEKEENTCLAIKNIICSDNTIEIKLMLIEKPKKR